MRRLRVGLAQIDCTVGDLDGNVEKIKEYCRRAEAKKVDLIAFPELAICGYPPEDLIYKPHFISDCSLKLAEIVDFSRELKEMTLIVGTVSSNSKVKNSAAIINDGRLLGNYHKVCLPNYGVFDEQRYFAQGSRGLVVSLGGILIGITICEDIWFPEGPQYVEATVGGAEIIININASPYHIDKPETRASILTNRAKESMSAIAYVNLVGGQDELVFDGRSLALDHNGNFLAEAESFKEDLLTVDFDADAVTAARDGNPIWEEYKQTKKTGQIPVETVVARESQIQQEKSDLPRRVREKPDLAEDLLSALTLGVADYVKKNHFARVLIGLSGGVDSALTAAIAVEALGPGALTAVFLPSRYTTSESAEDAAAVARNLGVDSMTISIDDVFATYLGVLGPVFENHKSDLTEENLQARIRGNILMALSNKFGWLLLSTGNKSEMSVGYATLYGDMSGGFAVLKDVQKNLVFELASHINKRSGKFIIPERIITKPPSAELRPNQKDSDSIPEYEILDPIVKAYVEENKSISEIVSSGFDGRMVAEVVGMIDRSEYKRRQAPPGVKVTGRAFGKDWRLPITNWYKDKPFR